MQVGMLDSNGYDWRESERYAENLKRVTAEQVRAVARKYFDPKTLTIATLLPEDTDSSQN